MNKKHSSQEVKQSLTSVIKFASQKGEEMEKLNLSGKRVLVIGSGLSGIGSAHLLNLVGAKPVILDENDKIKKEDIISKLSKEDADKTEIIVGKFTQQQADDIDLVVPSPAVPLDSELLLMLKAKNKRIWSEIELAYNFAKGDLIAITGTNGKTTTTTLVGEIMKAYFESVFVVGNIGFSYAASALDTKDSSVTVAEISSFQLEAVENFHAKISAILNITPDHLNRHHTMECYAQTKANICNNQTKEDVCVLNYDNEYTREFGEKCPARVIYFSSQAKLENGFYLDGDEIFMGSDAGDIRIMNIHDMNLVGMCNYENVMAAIAIAVSMNVPMDTILNVIHNFKAVEHRIEFVATKNGVDYYNDSKGTNPDAAIQGIKAMDRPTILIGGGVDKGSEYDEWIENFDKKVKKLVLIGQTKEKIAKCAREHGFTDIVFKDTFDDCLSYCTEIAEPGDCVLLSPACASWGMFPNYEVRGKMFKAYVNNLD